MERPDRQAPIMPNSNNISNITSNYNNECTKNTIRESKRENKLTAIMIMNDGNTNNDTTTTTTKQIILTIIYA